MTIYEAIIEIDSRVEKGMELARRIEEMRSNWMKRSKKKNLIAVALNSPNEKASKLVNLVNTVPHFRIRGIWLAPVILPVRSGSTA